MVSFASKVSLSSGERDDCETRVVVLNDPVNLMSYVAMVFARVLGMEREQAEVHMGEVHEQGRSIVWTGEREQAESYAYQLQEWHLQTILERDERD